MDMNTAVAKAIGAERSIAGLTVRELSAETGIPERSLMRILQAERDIKVNQVEQIAEALRLYPHEIIERAEVILERSARIAPVIDGGFGQNAEPTATDMIDDAGIVPLPERYAADEGPHAADTEAADEAPEER